MTICRPVDDVPALLKPHEVAALFRVEPATVWRWQRKGILTCVRTPGGHRRYLREQVAELLAEHAAIDDEPGSWA